MTTAPDHSLLIDEQLSAWLDDELPREELELLTARLAGSPEFQARVARYTLISSSLRGGHVATELAALQLSGRVGAALDKPGGPDRQPAAVRRSRVLPYAIAAGLALVAVTGAVLQGSLSSPAADPEPGAVVADRVQQSTAWPPGAVAKASLSARRLTSYLVYHGEYSGLLSARVTESHIVHSGPDTGALLTAERSPTR